MASSMLSMNVFAYIYMYFELLIISVFLGGHSSFALGHIGRLTSRLHHLEEEGESVAPVEDAEGKDRGRNPNPSWTNWFNANNANRGKRKDWHRLLEVSRQQHRPQQHYRRSRAQLQLFSPRPPIPTQYNHLFQHSINYTQFSIDRLQSYC